MPCYHPIPAWQSEDREVILWRPPQKGDKVLRELELPCARCEGCLLERSRQWAVRCMHEAQMWENNCFITLTYRETPSYNSLRHSDFQAFMKALRKKYSRKRDNDGGGIQHDVYPDWHPKAGQSFHPIRFYMAGEYGTQRGRPHYHACLFNHNFEDLELLRRTNSGSLIYRSAELEKLWPHGFSSVGDVTFESAAYVARYVMKKAQQEEFESNFTDEITGEYFEDVRVPEYNRMSLRPYGIGAKWLSKYQGDVFPEDCVVVKGHKTKPPRYYTKYLEKVDPDLLEQVELARVLGNADDWEHKARCEQQKQQPDLGARQSVLKAKLKKLERTF